MTHLGSFGEDRQADEITFDYFGTTVHANPELGELDYVDFMDKAGSVDVDTGTGLSFVKDFARLCIAEGDFDEFWALARKNKQKVEDVFKVLRAIVEQVSDRPTMQPSGSLDGHATTDGRFEAGLSSTLTERLEGRPDLQLLVLQQQRAAAG